MTATEKFVALSRERDNAAYRVTGGLRGSLRIAELMHQPVNIADLRELLADYDRAAEALSKFQESPEWTGEVYPTFAAVESAGNA